MVMKNLSGYYTMRSLLEFDIAGNIPAGSIVTSAKIYLYYYRYYYAGTDHTLDLHKVQQSPARDWHEMEVTWDRYETGSAWASAGGDYSGTVSASKTFPYTPYGWIEWTSNQLVSDVQEFLDNPSNNFGWILKHHDEGAGASRVDFYSSEASSKVPYLEITYETP